MTNTVSRKTSTATSPATLAGLIAIGHSALTGENSDPNHPHAPVPANSWATGTNPAVDSIYQRMLAQWPDTKGHVYNGAVGGATASALPGQIESALLSVPAPRLVIIQTIDNDLNCPIADSAFADFGASIDTTLHTITQASPRSQVLILLNHVSAAKDFQGDLDAAKADPKLIAQMTGPPPCGELDKTHHVQLASAKYLDAEVVSFNAEILRVCAKYPTCVTTKGHENNFTLAPNGVNPNNDHLSVVGLAAMAKFYWPMAKAAILQGS